MTSNAQVNKDAAL